ncbi:50S ribosomal protein L10 [Patescibacteria group bacterium]
MPSQKNVEQLEKLIEKFEAAKSVVWANYAGLSVADQTNLRAVVSEAGGEFTVAKNNLIRLALQKRLGKDPSEEVIKSLEGPTAIMFSNDDAVAPLKALVTFAEEHDLPEVKLGYMDDKILSVQEVKDLSKLPSKDQLIAQLVGQLKAPISGFYTVTSGNLRGLVQALKAIKDSKEK